MYVSLTAADVLLLSNPMMESGGGPSGFPLSLF